MSDIDLIPASYRNRRSVRRWIKQFAIAYAAAIVCMVAAKAFLATSIDAQASEVKRLETDMGSVLQKKAYLEQLEREHALLAKRAAVLERLRDGPPVKEVFLAIDRALGAGVWFLEWKFMRAGEFVTAATPTAGTGYFVMIPQAEAGTEARAWRVRTHMEVKARASDHTALAGFVRELASQPFIEDVKVLTTRSKVDATPPVVDFDLAVVVGGARERS